MQNSANAAPASVEFNPVTIRNGAKIHVNGDKSLTAIDNGSKLFSDQTNGSAVTDSQISSELSNFKSSRYGNDAINSVTGNASLLSASLLDSNFLYASTTDSAYWLSDTKEQGLNLRAFRRSDNYSGNNSKYVSGETSSGYIFAGGNVPFGSYGVRYTTNLKGATPPSKTYMWSLNGTEKVKFNSYYASVDTLLEKGLTIYNNPMCFDDPAQGFYSTTIVSVSSMRSTRDVGGIVSGTGSSQFIKELKVGDGFNSGDVLFTNIGNGYLGSSIGFKSHDGGTNFNVFFRTRHAGTISNKNSGWSFTLVNVVKDSDKIGYISGSTVSSDRYSIRPIFSFDSDNIAFVRSKTSGSNLVTSSVFGEVPSSEGRYADNLKLVVKSDGLQINSAISDDKLSTNNSDNNRVSTTYANGTIRVPYGASILNFSKACLDTANSNYISALVNFGSTNKYSVLSSVGDDFSIDLTSALSNLQVGSTSSISFYAEHPNSPSVSDEISSNSVSLQLEIVEGAIQNLKYSLSGGDGNLPSGTSFNAGKTYTVADGSGLSKDGNNFSCWKMIYVPFGETEEITRLVRSNEPIIVPDANSNGITFEAIYGGISAHKSTDSKSSVIKVTWDANAPSGAIAVFEGSGTFNEDRTQRIDKVKIAGSSVSLPSAPRVNVDSKIFDGWYTDAINGTKVLTESINPTENATYYAHWIDGYKVTYDASGGAGAKMSGSFSDKTTNDEEIVQPGNKSKGPGKGDPSPNDTTGMYEFDAWYTQPNGAGTKTNAGSSINATTKLYANYKLVNTFMARASQSTANPRNISGTKYSLSYVKAAATSIAASGSSSSYYSTFNSWMNNDSYHLYTLLNNKDASNQDSWVEFRIINVGSHDSDGSGLTFQAIHMLPTAYKMANDTSSAFNTTKWSQTVLYSSMTYGTIYNMFDSRLRDSIKNISSKGNFWLASWSELAGAADSSYGNYSGSQYAYWKTKSINYKVGKDNSSLVIKGKRSGDTSVASINSAGAWWSSTPITNSNSWKGNAISISSRGNFYAGHAMDRPVGVVPCFSL